MKKKYKRAPIPKTVYALGMKITVEIVDKVEGGNHGNYCDEERKISISNNQSPELQWRTFYHEWVHAVQFRSGVFGCGLKTQVLEIMAETEGNAIYEFISKNCPSFHENE